MRQNRFRRNPPAAILGFVMGVAFAQAGLGQAVPAPSFDPGPQPGSRTAQPEYPPAPVATSPYASGLDADSAGRQPSYDTPALPPPSDADYPSPNSLIGGTDPYIDSAIPRSQIRLRYDAADHDNRPDRAEFFYPQNGPQRASAQPVDFQEFTTYLEYAPKPNMSAFIEVPTRFLHIPAGRNAQGHVIQSSQNFSGFSDLQLGYKYAVVTNPDFFYSFQLRTYLPTGAGTSGMGTTHASIEPGFLVFQRLTDRVYFAGEFKDWIPLHGSLDQNPGDPNLGRQYAGNVLNYGVGLFYNMILSPRFRVAPTAEVVGWTVLGGLEEVTPTTTRSAAGDTIVNTMAGLRFSTGNFDSAGGGSPLNDKLSLFVGYSRSVTGDVWYKDMLRVDLNWYY